MSQKIIDEFQRRSETLQARYQFGFASKPRITRRIEDMDAILSDANLLVEESSQNRLLPDELRQQIRDQRDLYRKERANILDAKKAGPAAVTAAVAATRANIQFSVYERHYAGQNRATRDLALLEDVIANLEEIGEDLDEARAEGASEQASTDREIVDRNLETYRAEADEIRAARLAGTPAEQAAAMALLANGQFEIYRVQFAGRSRVGRRPALLQRVIDTLEYVESRMNELQSAGLEGETIDTNSRNIEIVGQRLDAYRAELIAIHNARQSTALEELVGQLGREANEVNEDYAKGFAGKARTDVSLTEISAICDRLMEIERQMFDLDHATNNPTNRRNLSIVQDSLLVYMDEYRQIREAQATPAPDQLH
jgi:hypothetical protein